MHTRMEVIRYTLPSTILKVVTDYSIRANTTTNLLTFTRKDKISITRHFPAMLMLILNPETMQNANHMSCFLLDFSSHIIKRQFSQPNHALSWILFDVRRFKDRGSLTSTSSILIQAVPMRNTQKTTLLLVIVVSIRLESGSVRSVT